MEAEGLLGQYSQWQIYNNLRRRIAETVSTLEHRRDLSIAEYKIDSVCRDAVQYQAVLPDGFVELLLQAFRTVHAIIGESNVHVSLQDDQQEGTSGYRPEVVHTGMIGRPSFLIHHNQLEFLAECRFSTRQMSHVLGVSKRTVKYRLQQFGISLKSSYSAIPDDELDAQVSSIIGNIPNSGLKIVHGYLCSRGMRVQRQRLRESLFRCDPARQELRQVCAIRRRHYSVSSPLALWHIDGNHKLIRWRFVVHGGIDGYSRTIVFLHASGNNWADTVLKCFQGAIEEWGLPSRVRADMGGENVLVRQYMMDHPLRGPHRGSFIGGRSVHNIRIERLWRDVYEAVLSSFYALFFHMEDVGVLAVDNEVHLYSLHHVFLPRINRLLQEYISIWNNHSIRTAHNQTPLQLFITGMHAVANDLSVIPNEYFADNTSEVNVYGIDHEAPLPLQEDGDVNVQPIQVLLSAEEHEVLTSTLNTEFPATLEDLWEYQSYLRCCEAVYDLTNSEVGD